MIRAKRRGKVSCKEINIIAMGCTIIRDVEIELKVCALYLANEVAFILSVWALST